VAVACPAQRGGMRHILWLLQFSIYQFPFGLRPAGSSQWQMEIGKWKMQLIILHQP
jgi:hypothetical protein